MAKARTPSDPKPVPDNFEVFAQYRDAMEGWTARRIGMRDAVRGRFVEGESVAVLARDYQMSRADIEQWLRLAMTERRRHRA